MKTICLLVVLGIAISQGMSQESNTAGEVVFQKPLSTNSQLIVVRLTRDYHPTNANQVVFGDVVYPMKLRAETNLISNERPGVNYMMPDIANTFVFSISTNETHRVELWRTEVVGFKQGFFPSSGYVFLDCYVSETDLAVAYMYNLAVCCDIVDLATRQGLPKEKTVVLQNSASTVSSLGQVEKATILPDLKKSGAITLRILPSGNPPMNYTFQNNAWVAE